MKIDDEGVSRARTKADLGIAQRYAELVVDSEVCERTFAMSAAEFQRTQRMVLQVSGQSQLLENNPMLARSIRLRDPYVDPMSLAPDRAVAAQTRRRRQRRPQLCARSDDSRYFRGFA